MSITEPRDRDAIGTLWEVLVAESELEGEPATPCGQESCFGSEPWRCKCACGPCKRALGLYARAQIESADLIVVLADLDQSHRVPKRVQARVLKRVLRSWRSRRPDKIGEGRGKTVRPGDIMRRTNAKRRSAGFTLVELLIVVAMVGVLASLAIVGYRKYIHSAQGSEATATIHMIRGAQEAYKAEMLQYLKVSSSLGSYYPNASPNDTRWAWVNSSHPDYSEGWRRLAVNPDGPVRFGYACTAGIAPTDVMTPFAFAKPISLPALPPGTPWYQIQAVNDHNANGFFAVFGSTSLSGEIVSESEEE